MNLKPSLRNGNCIIDNKLRLKEKPWTEPRYLSQEAATIQIKKKWEALYYWYA